MVEADEQNKWFRDFQAGFLSGIRPSHKDRIESLLSESKAQLHQDLFALSSLNFKSDGFFVEVGAGDGVHLSNTFLLEQRGWRGILAEPAEGWQPELKKNRTASLDYRAVWSSTGERLLFKETNPPTLSTLSKSNPEDMHFASRQTSNDYLVSTVSLKDLLDQHSAPQLIHFLSIDTEGSELEILESFDFSCYSFAVVCLEHNHTSSKDKIRALMASHGYERVVALDTLFDDWFTRIP